MTTPPLLIGLTGRAGTGKDTAAAYMEDAYAFRAIGFADPIVDMLGALIEHVDVDGAWLVERALKEMPMRVIGRSYRELAQTLGTEWGRALDPDFWIRIAAYRVQQIHQQGDNVVITDVRFANEAAWVRAMGGHVVRLVRDSAAPVREHASEQQIDLVKAERTLDNNYSKATLQDQIDRLIDELRTEPSA